MLFTLDERMAFHVGSYKSGNKSLRKAVRDVRRAISTNFAIPAKDIMAMHARSLGLEDAGEVSRFLGDLVEEGL